MNKETFNISKLSVDNKTRTLSVEYGKASVTKSSKILNSLATETGDQPVHQDVLTNLQLLVPHMLMIVQMPGFNMLTAGYINKKEALKDADIKGFYVQGFSVSEKGMITITGGVRTDTGRVTAMNAPPTSLDEENSPYVFVKDLNDLVSKLYEESYLYFTEGKFGEGAQASLPLKEAETSK